MAGHRSTRSARRRHDRPPVAADIYANPPLGISMPSLQSDSAWGADKTIPLDAAVAAGAQWIRLDCLWAAHERTSGVWSEADFSNDAEIIDLAAARGLKVLLLLCYNNTIAPYSALNNFVGPFNATQRDGFAAYAAEMVSRFKNKVKHWEVWNEPNAGSFWKDSSGASAPNAANYTLLLQAAYNAIKGADSSAQVIIGGLCPSSTSPQQFFKDIYANGGGSYFDAVGWHPYYFPTSGTPTTVAATPAGTWTAMYSGTDNALATLASNGQSSKKIWGTEYGCPGWPVGTSDSTIITGVGGRLETGLNASAGQDGELAQTLAMWRGFDPAQYGPLFLHRINDNSAKATTDRERWFGLYRTDWTLKPAFDVYRSNALSS